MKLKSLSIGLFLMVLYSVHSHSETNDQCHPQFVVKPKRVKLLSPEEIRSLKREIQHSLQPKHLFFKKGKKWGDLRWTLGQFQALNLNNLHPQTLEVILTRKKIALLLSGTQIKTLDLNALSPEVLQAFMMHPLGVKWSDNFQDLRFSRWSYEQLKPFMTNPALARYFNQDQIQDIKRLAETKYQDSVEDSMRGEPEEKEALALRLLDKENAFNMNSVSDHGIFDIPIFDGSFDKRLIPYLRISDLSDSSVHTIMSTLYELARDSEEHAELSDYIFSHLSNENVTQLFKRSKTDEGLGDPVWLAILPFIKDHSPFSDHIYKLFAFRKVRDASGKAVIPVIAHDIINAKVSDQMDWFVKIRFKDLGDNVIDMIREVLFYKPASPIIKRVSKENIAELIRRPGGLKALILAVPDEGDSEEKLVFTALFKENLLTDEIFNHVLSERPVFLWDFSTKLLSQTLIDQLENVSSKTPVSEFFKPGFSLLNSGFFTAFKSLWKSRIETALDIDHIEALIKNPYIISSEKFQEIQRRENSQLFFYKNIYENTERKAPKGFVDGHFEYLVTRLKSLLELNALMLGVVGASNDEGLLPVRIVE
ncbi:MAG: hypothetical protein OXB86_03320 [Bdellovibrionales bacterium]|nr:hypothetical protein [Bdellovibrionales bacterium]